MDVDGVLLAGTRPSMSPATFTRRLRLEAQEAWQLLPPSRGENADGRLNRSCSMGADAPALPPDHGRAAARRSQARRGADDEQHISRTGSMSHEMTSEDLRFQRRARAPRATSRHPSQPREPKSVSVKPRRIANQTKALTITIL